MFQKKKKTYTPSNKNAIPSPWDQPLMRLTLRFTLIVGLFPVGETHQREIPGRENSTVRSIYLKKLDSFWIKWKLLLTFSVIAMVSGLLESAPHRLDTFPIIKHLGLEQWHMIVHIWQYFQNYWSSIVDLWIMRFLWTQWNSIGHLGYTVSVLKNIERDSVHWQ